MIICSMITIVDILFFLITYIYIFGVIFYIDRLKKTMKIDSTNSRKLIHILIGSSIIIAPIIFSNNILPSLIGFSFILFTFLTSPISPIKKFQLSIFSEGHSLGTTYYSISLTVLIYLFFDQPWIIFIGFLPLVFGDAFANIFGVKYGTIYWPYSKKTVQGSFAGYIASCFALFFSLSLYVFLGLYNQDFITIILISVLSSIIMMIIELLSPKGTDNLSIPFFCTLFAIFVQ